MQTMYSEHWMRPTVHTHELLVKVEKKMIHCCLRAKQMVGYIQYESKKVNNSKVTSKLRYLKVTNK